MKEQRWLRIIPVAVIMYTIAYIDRTNISLALDKSISSMMRDLLMDDKMKGFAGGVFFLGYVILQIPGGHLANHWSAKKLVSILLVLWGICAVGCGLVSSFNQFAVMRFLLGVAESGVFPATLVLLANWFPRTERARANAFWNVCQPVAVAVAAPVTACILKVWPVIADRFAQHPQLPFATYLATWRNWQAMLIVEGVLPFLWLPIWLYFISDRPGKAGWISREEREHLEVTLAREANELEPAQRMPLWRALLLPAVLIMLPIYFLQNCAAYGCMTFLGEGLKGQGAAPTGLRYGLLFGLPYIVAPIFMLANSWHSDKTRERRGHVALAYGVSGASLIASVLVRPYSFWLSYIFLCLAIPGPFSGLAPFWAIPAETLPRGVMGAVMGLVNAIGNLGGFLGQTIVGWLKDKTGDIGIPFEVLGLGLLIGAALCFLLPKSKVAAPVNTPVAVAEIS